MVDATLGETGRVRRHGWWVSGLVLLVGGLAVVAATRAEAGFAWLAYTPAEPGTSLPPGAMVLVSRGQLVGAGVAVLGLLVLSAGVGFRLGRRRVREAGSHRPA